MSKVYEFLHIKYSKFLERPIGYKTFVPRLSMFVRSNELINKSIMWWERSSRSPFFIASYTETSSKLSINKTYTNSWICVNAGNYSCIFGKYEIPHMCRMNVLLCTQRRDKAIRNGQHCICNHLFFIYVSILYICCCHFQ